MQWFTMKETAAVALVYNCMNVAAAVALCASACHSRPDLMSQQELGPVQLLATLIQKFLWGLCMDDRRGC